MEPVISKLLVVDSNEPVVLNIVLSNDPVKLFNDVSKVLTPLLNVAEVVSNAKVASPLVAPPLKPFPAQHL